MGRAHANGYNRIHNFFPELEYEPKLVAVCSRNEEKVKAFAAQWNFESYETDWKALVAREDIDAVDICTPNDSHFEIALACAAAGKMILCEKPLARTLEEGQQMVDAIQKAGVKTTVWYNYRRIPAVTLAKNIIDSGKLGKIYHYRANFYKIGPLAKTCHREVRDFGVWMWMLQAQGYRRPFGSLHRHRDVVEWRNNRCVGYD